MANAKSFGFPGLQAFLLQKPGFPCSRVLSFCLAATPQTGRSAPGIGEENHMAWCPYIFVLQGLLKDHRSTLSSVFAAVVAAVADAVDVVVAVVAVVAAVVVVVDDDVVVVVVVVHHHLPCWCFCCYCCVVTQC